MDVYEMIEDMKNLTLGDRLDLLESVISDCKEELEILIEEQKKLFDEVGEGYTTASGSKVVKRTRKSTSIDVEMFRLIDNVTYLKLAEEGMLTVPSKAIKTLDQDSPYITSSVNEWYTLKTEKKE